MTEASIGFLNYTDEVGPIGRASYFNKVRNETLSNVSGPFIISGVFRDKT